MPRGGHSDPNVSCSLLPQCCWAASSAPWSSPSSSWPSASTSRSGGDSGAGTGGRCGEALPVLLPGSAARFVPSWPDASPTSAGAAPMSCVRLFAHAASRGSIMMWLSTTARPGAAHHTPVLGKLTLGTASPANPVGLEQGL